MVIVCVSMLVQLGRCTKNLPSQFLSEFVSSTSNPSSPISSSTHPNHVIQPVPSLTPNFQHFLTQSPSCCPHAQTISIYHVLQHHKWIQYSDGVSDVIPLYNVSHTSIPSSLQTPLGLYSHWPRIAATKSIISNWKWTATCITLVLYHNMLLNLIDLRAAVVCSSVIVFAVSGSLSWLHF